MQTFGYVARTELHHFDTSQMIVSYFYQYHPSFTQFRFGRLCEGEEKNEHHIIQMYMYYPHLNNSTLGLLTRLKWKQISVQVFKANRHRSFLSRPFLELYTKGNSVQGQKLLFAFRLVFITSG